MFLTEQGKALFPVSTFATSNNEVGLFTSDRLVNPICK